jgi:phosphatidylserine/phosphatidylglycerophosphate/cardiolipin synthase-like enzyme
MPATVPDPRAAALLDLVELARRLDDGPVASGAVTLAGLAHSLCPAGDRSTLATIESLLVELGLAPTVTENDAQQLRAELRLVQDLRNVIMARTPPPPSRLVVTAAGSDELRQVQTSLRLVPLFQLVEDVIRSTDQHCWLGAPYWNAAAIEQLRPALGGLARREGHVTFVCQGGPTAGQADPLPFLRRAAGDIVSEGGQATVLAFETRTSAGANVLLHAKFALADGRMGYLGSANMTGQGFGDHLEVGVRLPTTEAAHLTRLLDHLVEVDLLQAR